MKSKIFCFSSTGNSLSSVQNITSAVSKCQVLSMNKGKKQMNFDGVERIGFIFSVNSYEVPCVVQDFIANNKFKVDSKGLDKK